MSAVTVATSNSPLSAFRPGPFLLPECLSVRTMSGNETWDNTYKPIQAVDPTAARDVTLPALLDGLWFFIANKANAAETITVKELAGGTTVETVDQNESILLVCDGTTWHVVSIFTTTIA